MNLELRKSGAHIDCVEFCPYHPEGAVERYRRVSDLRKPAPGMVKKLLAEWPVDASRSFLVGDRSTDLEAAAAAGIRGHLFPAAATCWISSGSSAAATKNCRLRLISRTAATASFGSAP